MACRKVMTYAHHHTRLGRSYHGTVAVKIFSDIVTGVIDAHVEIAEDIGFASP